MTLFDEHFIDITCLCKAKFDSCFCFLYGLVHGFPKNILH